MKTTQTDAGQMYGKLPARAFHLLERVQGTPNVPIALRAAVLIGSSDSIETINKLRGRYRNWPAGSVMVVDANGSEVK